MKKCIICGHEFNEYGNNPDPLCRLFCEDPRSECENCKKKCCNACDHYVIFARDGQIFDFIEIVESLKGRNYKA